VLELAILGLLKERPMHGYDLRKRLRDGFGPLSNLSFGSLYPALARLEAAGALRSVAVEPAREDRGRVAASLALTGSLAGERAALAARRATARAAAALGGRSTRARKVYEITPRGEELFDRLLEDPDAGSDGRAFSLRLAFARHLSPQARVRLLERRRIQLADRLRRAARSAQGPPLDPYERSLAEHAAESLANDLSWIERLLAAERRALGDEEAAAGPEADDDRGRVRAAAGTTSTEGRTGP
jgi:DNA-binding PadR family transcriptional regulator